MRRAAGGALVLTVLTLVSAVPSVAAADDPPPDICLNIGTALDEVGSAAVVDAVRESLAARPVLIPAPLVGSVAATETGASDSALRLGVWAAGEDGAVETLSSVEGSEWCGEALAPGSWAVVLSGAFLRAGTKRELAAARTTPGFSSSIDVEWDEGAELVRTVLTFSGPLDIPNGTCWMDDIVAADGQGGTVAVTTTGSRTSPFGDGVCGRFEESLPDGGAGAQAILLLPREIELPDGSVLRLRVDVVDVRDDGVHLTGTLERGVP